MVPALDATMTKYSFKHSIRFQDPYLRASLQGSWQSIYCITKLGRPASKHAPIKTSKPVSKFLRLLSLSLFRVFFSWCHNDAISSTNGNTNMRSRFTLKNLSTYLISLIFQSSFQTLVLLPQYQDVDGGGDTRSHRQMVASSQTQMSTDPSRLKWFWRMAAVHFLCVRITGLQLCENNIYKGRE